MQWSEEEFFNWIRGNPTAQDLIERARAKDQPPGDGYSAAVASTRRKALDERQR